MRLVTILVLFTAISFSPASAQDDVADVPAERLTVDGQERMTYMLIGVPEDADPPPDGYGLLVVLPGGDGSAEFTPFVKRIHKHAVPDGFLTAQLIAVTWTDSQQITWPTQSDQLPDRAFATEQFIAAVVDHVGRTHPLDRRRVFTLSWSSGGPAAYTASLAPDTPITGSLVAMSVFQPNKLPSLDGARGQAYYILQSPQDEVVPMFHAQEAAQSLADHGAHTLLVEYAGGHGWRGDVFGMIGDGIDWLEQNAGQPVDEAPADVEGINLLDNGGFETGREGWIIGSNSGRMELTIDNNEKAEGDASLRVSKTGAMPLDIVRINVDGLEPGQRIVVSARVKADNLGNAWMKFFAWDDAGNDLIRNVDVARIHGSHDWRRVRKRYTIPDEADSAAVQFWMILDGTMWIDDVRVTVEE